MKFCEAAAFFAILYYFLFFQLNVGIPAYSSAGIVLEVSLELVEKYGERMDETEFWDFLTNFIDADAANLTSQILVKFTSYDQQTAYYPDIPKKLNNR